MGMFSYEESNFKDKKYLFENLSMLIEVRLPLESCVTLDMSLGFSEPQFLCV